MEGMEEKLGAIMSNPQLMQQIMAMAQSISPPQQPTPADNQPSPASPVPDFDPAMIQQLMGLAGQMGVDANQKALLSALRPYLTGERIGKLEKAMRAAKLASLASTALGSGALSFLTGR